MPMSELMKLLPQISHDRNGEFKINITKDFQLALKGRGNRKPLNEFLNNWDLITLPAKAPGEVASAEQSFHTVLQGRLIEIGNDRGLQTYSPNRAKKFEKVQLSDLTTWINVELQFANYDSSEQRRHLVSRKLKQYHPHSAFEVELSTNLVRCRKIGALRNTHEVFVVSKRAEWISAGDTVTARTTVACQNVATDHVGVLYSAEHGFAIYAVKSESNYGVSVPVETTKDFTRCSMSQSMPLTEGVTSSRSKIAMFLFIFAANATAKSLTKSFGAV
jgi:hypothetical protein